MSAGRLGGSLDVEWRCRQWLSKATRDGAWLKLTRRRDAARPVPEWALLVHRLKAWQWMSYRDVRAVLADAELQEAIVGAHMLAGDLACLVALRTFLRPEHGHRVTDFVHERVARSEDVRAAHSVTSPAGVVSPPYHSNCRSGRGYGKTEDTAAEVAKAINEQSGTTVAVVGKDGAVVLTAAQSGTTR